MNHARVLLASAVVLCLLFIPCWTAYGAPDCPPTDTPIPPADTDTPIPPPPEEPTPSSPPEETLPPTVTPDEPTPTLGVTPDPVPSQTPGAGENPPKVKHPKITPTPNMVMPKTGIYDDIWRLRWIIVGMVALLGVIVLARVGRRARND